MKIIEQLLILFIKLLESIFKGIFEFIQFAWTAIPKKKDSYNAESASQAEEIYQLRIRIKIRSSLEVLVLENQAWCSFLHYTQ